MQMMMNQDKSISAFPQGENLFEWGGTITGPAGTVYEGMTFKLSLTFPSDYPMLPPTIKFVTPCYHPNVDTAGHICLDILKEKWSPAYTINTALLSLQTLLGDPNNDSPLNAHAAGLWDDQAEYREVVRAKYAEATAQQA
jgi:ubiquitin-conjugating enzyme E2 C